ncbi:MAG: hypothetical protein U1E11_06300 [Dethiobacteria bacterium]|nr:hypothetical protein [Dethiobacteria bacterium]
MKRTLVAVALVIVFVMALAAPAFAQAITHSATYEMDGVINFKKQMGHLCNTGAEIKQTIMGSGQLDKVQTVSMVSGKITMKDANDGVAGATPLTVTTVWELCAPPKYTYEDDDGNVAIVHPAAMFGAVDQPYVFGPLGFQDAKYDMAPTYADWEAVSDQIWAVQVAADPGYSINVMQDGVAAYGPYDSDGYMWLGEDDFEDVADSRWAWANTDWDVVVGEDYVGNYFSMNQHARTSMGTLKRYISVSSPFSHGYLMEDMSVVGKSDVKEAFAMVNLPAGADVPGLWWDLF